jgi:glycosyltransferase involved in cell wall biosynthesis
LFENYKSPKMPTQFDVCFILEGTYPFIVGGVSHWVQQLVTGLPNLRFSVVHLRFDKPGPNAYAVPNNVTVQVVDLSESPNPRDLGASLPMQIDMPVAKVYHALSTGFAGLLGLRYTTATQQPFLLTEHGIYWHEIVSGADEIESGFRIVPRNHEAWQVQVIRDEWGKALRETARAMYQGATHITTVCQSNREMQLDLGAIPSRTQVIPNGVTLPARPARSNPQKPHFALVGRVVPIKRVHIFLEAAALVRRKYPHARFSVIGPLNHDSTYVQECWRLAKRLGLPSSTFLGQRNPAPYYQHLTAMVLTSQSEALPFAALEAMSYGVPVVLPAVGGCAELVYGQTATDAPAGILLAQVTATELADSLCRFLQDRPSAQSWGKTARQRVHQFYSLEQCLTNYRKVYQQLGI